MLDNVADLATRFSAWRDWSILVLVALRVVGLFLVAPFFRSPFLPWRLRIGIVGVLAMAMLVTAVRSVDRAAIESLEFDSWSALPAFGGELVVGCALGWVVFVVLAAVESAATLISQQLGLSASTIADPQGAGGDNVPGALPFFYRTFAIFIFLALDLHLVLLRVLVRSFTYVPLGTPGFDDLPEFLGRLVLELTPDLFAAAVTLALPVLVALFVVSVLQAALGRVLPEAELFTLGIPARVLVGVVVLVATLPVSAEILTGFLSSAAWGAERWLEVWLG